MEESSTYQAILRKGVLQERRQSLWRVARQRFGNPPADVDTALGAIVDADRLERIMDRLLLAADWNDLLSTP